MLQYLKNLNSEIIITMQWPRIGQFEHIVKIEPFPETDLSFENSIAAVILRAISTTAVLSSWYDLITGLLF